MRTLPEVYGPPEGLFHLMRLERMEGQIGGCAGLRKIDEGVCEMARLFIRPQFRGRGLGRRMAADLLQKAQEMGYRTVRLHTLPSMREATALYRTLGFEEIPPYGENPVEGAIFMAFDLERAPAARPAG